MVFGGDAVAGMGYRAGAILNNFANGGFHVFGINTDYFINPHTGITDLEFFLFFLVHGLPTLKYFFLIKISG
jgi:hypothetical protein